MSSLSQPQAAATTPSPVNTGAPSEMEPLKGGKLALSQLECLGDGAFARKAAPAAKIIHAKHGERECVNCAYYDPKRKKKGKDWPCSPFGQLQNKDKDCSLYHEDMTPVEERVKWY